MILFVIALTIVHTSRAIIGFDCGGQHLNITTVSLLEAGDCDLNFKSINTSDVYIQLVQLSEYNYAEVLQCKLEISRTIFRCGMHSHISIVHNGQASYLEDVPLDKCRRMHADGAATIGINNLITGLKVNTTSSRSITLAGKIDVDGTCEGVSYADPYGSWEKVVVQAVTRISLKSSYVPVHLNTGKIHLKSGTTCTLSDGFCIDPDEGHTYWKPIPTSSCDFHQYDVLYEGMASKTSDVSNEFQATKVYSLTTQDITFALTTTKELPLCGYTLLHTEHPKLFILETRKGNSIKPRGEVAVDNLDIFTYVNSKFVYVEKHIRSQITSLYYNVMQQRCELEREVIKNTLSFASLLPDEFAYRLMKGPGYMAVTAGEAIHVIQCIPVEATPRKTKECFTELPVTVRNTSLFLTPKSRVITKYGTQRECSYDLPTLYRIEQTWVRLTPEPHVQPIPPQPLKPMSKMTWTYLTPGPLASSGIYSQKDIEKLREHIMFSAEKPAVLNSLARGITGYANGPNTASMYDLLNEEALEKIAEGTARKIWDGFVVFGSATAGFMGIFILIRLVKLIVDTAIHGYTLHLVYGCSLHLIGAIWGSLTHLLLHLARGDKKQPGGDPEEPKEDTTNKVTNSFHPVNHHNVIREQPVSSFYLNMSRQLRSDEQNPQLPSDFVLQTGGRCNVQTSRGE